VGRRLFGWGTAFVLEANRGTARLLDGQGREIRRCLDRGPLQAASRLWQEWSDEHSVDSELPGPLAIGVFAFDLSRAPTGAWAGVPQLRLTVPATTVVVEEGKAWFVTASRDSAGPDLLRFGPAPVMGSRSFYLPMPSGPLAVDWSSEVARALEAIRTRRWRKVVLAQELVLATDRPLDAELAMERLRAAAPDSWSFRIPVGPGRTFVGSSPELLLRGSAGELESWPLAGTLAIEGDDPEEVGRLLAASDKDLREHRAVVEQVGRVLRGYCHDLRYPSQPEPVLFPGMAHLGTRIRGRVKAGVEAPVLEVLARLHPTPAVAGTPVGPAMALIRRVESFDRGWYAGGVGWVGPGGTGEFALAIRSVLLTADKARLFAGAGIVAGSDPALERAELELKLGSVLRPLLGARDQPPDRSPDRRDHGPASLDAAGRGERDR
jgi:isochorismate synthase